MWNFEKTERRWGIILWMIALVFLLILVHGVTENEQETAVDNDYPSTSMGLPVLYLEMRPGTLEKLHADKNDKQQVGCTFLDVDGDRKKTVGVLSGRGNSTWEEVEEEVGSKDFKHPYNLTLSSEVSLYGMKSSKKYVLLANYYDPSFLKNAIALTAATECGLRWTPEFRFVNLYADREYLGLYLLTQRISPDGGCMDSAVTGVYCFDFSDRLADKKNSFHTEHRGVELIYPSEPQTNEALMKRRNELQIVENSIYAGASLENILDEDSFARYSLIQEFFCNHDADTTSQYIYTLPGEGNIYAGPVWDFDLSMGHEWASFGGVETRSNWIESTLLMRGWLYELMQRQEFGERCRTIYLNELSPALHRYLENSFYGLTDTIRESALADNELYSSRIGFDEAGSQVREWLTARLAFMDAYMAEPEVYRIITLNISKINYGRRNMCLCVRKGEPVGELPLISGIIGYRTESGEKISTDFSVLEDMVLEPIYEERQE